MNRRTDPSSFSSTISLVSGVTGSTFDGFTSSEVNNAAFTNFSKIQTDYVTIEQCFLETFRIEFRLRFKKVEGDSRSFTYDLQFGDDPFQHIQDDHVVESEESFDNFWCQHVQIKQFDEWVDVLFTAEKSTDFGHIQKDLVFSVKNH